MARAGILTPDRGPRREYRFGFQDLVLLRSARTLLDALVPRRRVHRALRQLVRQLPEGRSASQVRLMVEGTSIVAHDGDAVWRTDDGQLVMPARRARGNSRPALSSRRRSWTTRSPWMRGPVRSALAPDDSRSASKPSPQPSRRTSRVSRRRRTRACSAGRKNDRPPENTCLPVGQHRPACDVRSKIVATRISRFSCGKPAPSDVFFALHPEMCRDAIPS